MTDEGYFISHTCISIHLVAVCVCVCVCVNKKRVKKRLDTHYQMIRACIFFFFSPTKQQLTGWLNHSFPPHFYI